MTQHEARTGDKTMHGESEDKIRVEVSIELRGRVGGFVELTRAEYYAWCERLDNARGYEEERAAEEMLDLCRLDLRDMNVSDLRVDDFVEIAQEEA